MSRNIMHVAIIDFFQKKLFDILRLHYILKCLSIIKNNNNELSRITKHILKHHLILFFWAGGEDGGLFLFLFLLNRYKQISMLSLPLRQRIHSTNNFTGSLCDTLVSCASQLFERPPRYKTSHQWLVCCKTPALLQERNLYLLSCRGVNSAPFQQ